jgi:hypothetical protein
MLLWTTETANFSVTPKRRPDQHRDESRVRANRLHTKRGHKIGHSESPTTSAECGC